MIKSIIARWPNSYRSRKQLVPFGKIENWWTHNFFELNIKITEQEEKDIFMFYDERNFKM